MGLTSSSTGFKTNKKYYINKKENGKIISLAGNPNVGKSTVFNELTGLNQHTGNWPGKTVSNAQGTYTYGNRNFTLVDLPGTYSLLASSVEEEVARDFICFGNPDTTVIVVDATNLERNLNLVLQIIELTDKAVLCLNLLDEAKKKKIDIDLTKLSYSLGIFVVGTSARNHQGLDDLMEKIKIVSNTDLEFKPFMVSYPEEIESAIAMIIPEINKLVDDEKKSRFISLKLLDRNTSLAKSLEEYLEIDILENKSLKIAIENAHRYLKEHNIEDVNDEIVTTIVKESERIYQNSVTLHDKRYNEKDQKIDKIFTSKWFGIPMMLLLLCGIFWFTITGANYPSELLSKFLFSFEPHLVNILKFIHTPSWILEPIVYGIYQTLASVVSVMLPPMAIFFPLFTLLEDSGFLPRIAFNMDHLFKKASCHGKQSLTMCMGFGCNACGVVGCRIIDSPRERLLAILTNNFVPCNGRFPMLISIITMFFAGIISSTFLSSITSTLILITVILICIIMTFLISKLLSKTLLKGYPSSFILELPPYRKPQIGKVIIRSILDRTIFVLGRAIMVAAPAGLLIWILANIKIGNLSILTHFTSFLDPFAKIIGLDGVILMAFILGLPANEIVMPIIIMSYLSSSTLVEFNNLLALKDLLVQNGWTYITAICTMIFACFHFPCGTTILTIKKETNSLKWTIISCVLPTIIGFILCFIVAFILRCF